ncbi:MAG: hypothetical protein HFI11_09320 [Lachnospiraceae bacterium]|nr:hypothetical protein [Lachnospiraceae bacterium]
MKYPFFASFIVFGFLFSFSMKRRTKKEKQYVDNFWEREREADSTRRKSLENLDYVAIPLQDLPMDVLGDLPEIEEYHEKLRELSGKKIVNFAGYSNTELKLEYGAPNINLLSEYDRNFEELITLLQEWASLLLQNWGEGAQLCPEEERKQAAKKVLAFAVSIGSDITASYEKLVKLYLEYGEQDKLPALKEKAQKIRSLSKPRILALLDEAVKG